MSSLDLVEWFGTLTGIACVWLAAREKILSWPLGILSVTAYAFFFFQIKLYADAGLQIFYIATGIVGWWHWARGGPAQSEAPIRTLPNGQRALVVAGAAVGVAVLGTLLARNTDASFPYWDSFTTCFSIAAQLLLMKKVYENWMLWVAVDVVAIGVYFAKGAFVTCGLYAVFLVLASWGWWSWRRSLAEGTTEGREVRVSEMRLEA